MSKDLSFTTIKEDAGRAAGESLESILARKVYNASEVQSWTGQVCEDVINRLKALNSNFKYTVTCIIMQRSDSGLHISSTCYWDCNTDGHCTVKWENSTMYCIVNIFGLAL